MLSKFYRGLLAALACVTLAGTATAQAPKMYPTGRKAPSPVQFMAMKGEALVAQAPLADATEAVWDSRTKGWIPPIKNQGNCGSCWDFSGTFVAEVALIKGGVLKPDADHALSEQYTLDCYENGGCNGDDNTTVLKHAKRIGLPLSRDYGAYRAREGNCKSQGLKLLQVVDWGFADGDAGYESVGSTQKIKNAIKAYGAVGCAIAADNAFMNVRPGQVFHGNSRQINHDVALIGWDDSKGAWLLRNSWGTDWCDGGYCLIAYGANHVGTEPVYAVMPAPEPTPAPPIDCAVISARTAIAVGMAALLIFCVVVLVIEIRRKPAK